MQSKHAFFIYIILAGISSSLLLSVRNIGIFSTQWAIPEKFQSKFQGQNQDPWKFHMIPWKFYNDNMIFY